MTKETQETNLIKSKDNQEDHSNPSTSKQISQNETQCSSFTTKITPNLPSMPFEIKEKIVYWVYWLHLPGSSNSTEVLKNRNDNNNDDDDDQFEDISDSDSETRYDKWKTQSNHKPTQTHKNEPEWDPKSRSEVLLQIFQTCPNIIDLDVDLDPEDIIPLPEPSDSTNDLEPDPSSSPSGQVLCQGYEIEMSLDSSDDEDDEVDVDYDDDDELDLDEEEEFEEDHWAHHFGQDDDDDDDLE
ncbi:uncharacterized protein MELLADRAFT_112240 [Melampsora larici-populina 98AG31]|uniref:Uncharacterized protein n=1 Tax=Melampsora larici-populina (strain 98AG31 / pathotype 3-4-7) TaxID=747676 RepID=F4S5U2_MELLP|nr:uncharacterized protein MELLADRAFT_112240 [Melampsora larici-populina 98AG31]EGF99956.1 hypothetical protein MELLADRAFT_112240 [Melampsora larici-populina 98AG31]